MKILVLESSGNKNGSSNMLAHEFARGAKEAGHEVTEYTVLEPELEPWGQRTCYIADPEGNLIEIGSWKKPYEEKDLTEG